jgi:tripartite-type tricarboxylate transporter receptor subunit TctC
MQLKRVAMIPVVLLLVLAIGGPFAAAAEYPKRPVTLICPWAAGGGTDAVSRILATLLQQELGQPFNVVNRTGGSGVVGHQAMATAKPDGYTIGLATVELTMMHWMGLTNLTYKDVTPIAQVNQDPAGIHVRSDAPWNTVAEIDAYVKDHPGELKDSGTGVGGIWHLAMAGWLKTAGMDPNAIRWIPSRGAAPALQDLMAGGIDLTTCSFPEAASLIEADRVKSLAIMADERDSNYPDVPTLKELGIDWTCAAWRGIVAPNGTPQEIVSILEAALDKIVHGQQFKDFMNKRGYGIAWKNAKEFGEYMAAADKANGEVMKAAGITK